MTKKKRLTLHDRFAKVSLQEKPIALNFFKAHLPQKIQTMIDWKTLKLSRLRRQLCHIIHITLNLVYDVHKNHKRTKSKSWNF